jgi:hypothetical protein
VVVAERNELNQDGGEEEPLKDLHTLRIHRSLNCSLEARLIFNHHGLRVSYDDAGSGNAVLFIHGHPFNRTMWRPQVESLRWKFRTIAPDLRG